MKTERRIMYVTVRVEFTCPEGMEEREAQNTAEHLAIRPNFNATTNGVSLEEVQVRFTETVNE